MTLFYISGHRKFKTKSRKVMKYEKTLVNFKPFFEFFDIWVPITFRDKELMVWNFEFPSFLLCPTIPFLPFWAIRKTGQIISIWTQFQQMLKIIEIAHILWVLWGFKWHRFKILGHPSTGTWSEYEPISLKLRTPIYGYRKGI